MVGGILSFASTENAESSGLLGSLGIDWQLLVLQSIAFLLLLVILSKYIFPVLAGILDKREKQIADSVRAAHDAEKNASETEAKVTELIKKARRDADEVLANAKTEAANVVDTAEKKSRERADKIVADAEAQLTKDVADARAALRHETLQLVAEATETVLGKVVTEKVDKSVVAEAVKEVKK